MFKKWLLFLLSVLVFPPAYSGSFEKAMEKGYNVFLYLYSPKCKYCTMFSPNYEKVLKTHDGEFVFIKVDASTKYGKRLMYEFSGTYVPFVVMINSQKKVAAQIAPDCLFDVKCIELNMQNFRNL